MSAPAHPRIYRRRLEVAYLSILREIHREQTTGFFCSICDLDDADCRCVATYQFGKREATW